MVRRRRRSFRNPRNAQSPRILRVTLSLTDVVFSKTKLCAGTARDRKNSWLDFIEEIPEARLARKNLRRGSRCRVTRIPCGDTARKVEKNSFLRATLLFSGQNSLLLEYLARVKRAIGRIFTHESSVF